MRTVVVTLPEIAAIYVDKYNNTANSTSGSCTIQGSNSWWYRTFLKYDTSLIPSGANIVRATMHVYCCYWNTYGGSGTTNISRVTTDWTESSVTSWSNQPSFTSNTYLPSNVSPPKVGEWGEWDVTLLVQEWSDGTPNYGLYIKNNNEGNYRRNWEIYNRRYNGGSNATYITVEYEAPSGFNCQGTALYEVSLAPVAELSDSLIEWSSDVPDNTSVVVETSVDGETWDSCLSGMKIPSLSEGVDYHDNSLLIRVTLQTDDEDVTPSVNSLRVLLRDANDDRVLILMFDAGNSNSVQRAAGDITVAYDGSGSLMGQGGPVLAFEKTFTPVGLDPKNNPHETEHLAIASAEATGTLTRVYYSSYYGTEHLDVSQVTAEGVLTHVDDI